MADSDALSEAGRALNARRWDPAVQLARAAATVISRASELDAPTKAAVHEATGQDTEAQHGV